MIFKINGKIVTKKEFGKHPPCSSGLPTKMNVGRVYTTKDVIKSDALAVHPDDRHHAMAHARAHGFAIDYDSLGRPHIGSNRQMREYAKLLGFHNKDDNA